MPPRNASALNWLGNTLARVQDLYPDNLALVVEIENDPRRHFFRLNDPGIIKTEVKCVGFPPK
jgi:hypothetical protein